MTLKRFLFLGPEIYLIIATLYYWSLTAMVINPYAIGLLIVLGFQVLYKKSATGILIASVFLILNLYLVLALISELKEFTEPNDNFKNLLIVGTLFLGINITAATFMLWKYIKKTL